jgi:DNA-binding SARP family transcriptional activator
MGQNETVFTLLEESRALERTGNVAAAIQRAQKANHLALSLGDTEAQAAAIAVLAMAHIRMGHYPEARRLCESALVLAAPDAPARADALLQLGVCAGETDDLPASEEYFRQAVDLSRQIGYDRALLRGLHGLAAGIYMPRGQFTLSLAADEECLQIARRRGMPEMLWGPLTTMSWNYRLMGQRHPLEKTLEALREVALPGSIGEGYWCYAQACLAFQAGDYEAARTFLAQISSSAEMGGLVELSYLYRIGMSQMNLQMGNASDALAWAVDTLSIAERIGYRHYQGLALIERGRAAWAMSDWSAAEANFRQAICVMAPHQLNFDIARAELFLAGLLHQQNSPEAPAAWRSAVEHITRGGFAFLVDHERTLALPLLAAHLTSPDLALADASQSLLEHLLRVPPAPLKVSTLGGLRVWVGGRLVDRSALRPRKAGELFAILLLAPDCCLSVDQVLDSLWSEREPALALQLFHQATSILRRTLEPELPEKFPSRYLSTGDGAISLRLPQGSQVDGEDFEAACTRKDWAAALDIYHGDFLPEYLYADWAAAQRQRLAYLHQLALLARAEDLLRDGQCLPTLEICRRVLACDAWQEQAVLLGMRACLEMGDRSGARRLYRGLEKTLGDELDAEPQAELQALYRSLQTGSGKRGHS